MLKIIDIKEILGALARGYCHPETEKEIMNPTLCQCQLHELLAMCKPLPSEGELKKIIKRAYQYWDGEKNEKAFAETLARAIMSLLRGEK